MALKTFDGDKPEKPDKDTSVPFDGEELFISSDGKKGVIRKYYAEDETHNLEAIQDLIDKKQDELDRLIAIRDTFIPAE